MRYNKKKFIYLISPLKIDKTFYSHLEYILKQKKVSFFQLRIKNEKIEKKLTIGKRIKKICKKFKVKFLINDDVFLAKQLDADGCHLGQNDMSIHKARKLIGDKIIGITCHNSIKLAKVALKNKADYIAFGAFYSTSTKKTKYKSSLGLLKKARKIIVPVLPSPIDMSAARDFLNSIRSLGSVIRNRTDICLVANRCRANTNIFEELDDYLVREKGIRYVTAFRDNTNYINAAKKGIGIFEMGESMTAQDREEWKPLLSWLNSKKRK